MIAAWLLEVEDVADSQKPKGEKEIEGKKHPGAGGFGGGEEGAMLGTAGVFAVTAISYRPSSIQPTA